MMNQNYRYLIVWFWEFLVMFVLGLSVGRYVTYTHQQDAKNIAHTNDVIDQIDRTFIIVLRAESSVKSYIGLGNPEYIEYYNQLKREYPIAYSDLRYLVQDNPDQRTNLSEFERAVQDKYLFLEKVLRMNEDGSVKNMGFQGKSLMDKLNSVYNKMKFSEYKLLNERTKILERNIFYLSLIIPGLVMLSFVLIISSYFLTKNEY